MSENTVYVGRPSKWGNYYPTKWGKYFEPDMDNGRQLAVDAYQEWVLALIHLGNFPDLEELRGKDLACYCRLGQPCHADVLLEIANK